MTHRHLERGYTLIVVVILLAVLMVLGASAIRIAGRDTEAAIAHKRQDMMALCTKAAREAIIGNMRLAQPMPKDFHIVITEQGVRAPNGGEEALLDLAVGHDPRAAPPLTEGGEPVFKDVHLMTDEELGRGASPHIHPMITNDIALGAGSFGSAARYVARCLDTSGERVYEVEFVVRFGL